MERVSIDEVEPTPDDDCHSDRRALADPLGTSNVAITRYVLEPGERFSGSVHTHMDQEEVFLVLEGTVTFELRRDRSSSNGEDGDDRSGDGNAPSSNGNEISVDAGEAIRFAPGEFQSGKNDADETVVAFALGAPKNSDDVRISRIPTLDDRTIGCPECGLEHMGISSGTESELVCPDCGATMDVE
ncbi:cupin [Halostagnicola sp. A-GB9-2]|uniref:cupin domain-containing protein n=1 Tax=Halostagnicola sp. A-GB9-2 TaxID=3048066 RepID=UPI0024BF2059|nr:cupin [Halostagnicola sp. A-GB9-2]MDJ1432981.1 cupin [Halostagnicola sp. A-GB9-2]